MNKEDQIKKDEIMDRIRMSQVQMQKKKDLGLATDEVRQEFINEQRALWTEFKPYMNWQDSIKAKLTIHFLNSFEEDLKRPLKDRVYSKTEGGMPKEAFK